MKSSQVMQHFREMAHGLGAATAEAIASVDAVDPSWPAPDQFVHGDPGCDVSGIAVAWMATDKVLKQAAQRGHNLFITHEPAFYQGGGYEQTELIKRMTRQKQSLLDQLHLTVLRIHFWDLVPHIGICDTWAKLFGFPAEPREVLSYHRIVLLPDMTVEQLAGHVLEKVRPFGQDTVLIWGDRRKRVSRMAVGTGAITRLPDMIDLNANVGLATDDGFRFYGPQAALDLDVPVLTVNHATSEKPGMESMASHLAQRFVNVPVEYFDVDLPYKSIHTQ